MNLGPVEHLVQPNIESISKALAHEYGSPRHGNPQAPLDDLIYIILSTRTQGESYRSTFATLRQKFSNWDEICPDRAADVEQIISTGGLGRLKATQIVDTIERLRECFGSATLDPLASMSTSDAEDFLTSLPGVGKKVAKCVLMYAFDRAVLPVDVHVHRVAMRLGFSVKRRPDTSQDVIEGAVPPNLRYAFHVNAIAHGRKVCVARYPRCSECCISTWCQYFRQHVVTQ